MSLMHLDPYLSLIAEPEPRTVMTFAPGWREAAVEFARELSLKGYSAYTIRDYRTDVLRFGAWLGVDLDAFGDRHLVDAEVFLNAEGIEEVAKRRRRSAYTRFLDFLKRRRGEVDPRSGAPGCASALLASFGTLPPADRVLFALVYFAGLRLTEIGNLEGRDIRFRQGHLVSRLGYRLVPLHPRLTQILDDARNVLPFAPFRPILPGLNGFALNARTLHARFQRLARRVGFPGVRPETLRREASSWLLQNGTPPGLVRAFLGRDRGRPIAPRRGRFVDLSCLGDRLRRLPA